MLCQQVFQPAWPRSTGARKENNIRGTIDWHRATSESDPSMSLTYDNEAMKILLPCGLALCRLRPCLLTQMAPQHMPC